MLTTEQKTGQLYKHFLSVSDTRDNRDFYEEAIQSSFCIRPDQLLMYGDKIPCNDEGYNVIRSLRDGQTYDWHKDEATVIPIVKCYKDYQLQKIDNGTDNAFKLVDEFGKSLRNIIPFNYYKDLYNYELKTSSGKKVYFGVGDWVLDTFSGVLKFYGKVPDGISHDNPPLLSFYQYVGGTGFRQDTFGYDGIIVPLKDWEISEGRYLINETNTFDGQSRSLEEQVILSANVVQDNYASTFGFDGSDTNEGIAYSLQPVIALTYASSKDIVKGYDDSADSDIGVILSRQKAVVDSASNLKITFCSNNILVGEHILNVQGNVASLYEAFQASPHIQFFLCC